jgi:hypothetical protein
MTQTKFLLEDPKLSEYFAKNVDFARHETMFFMLVIGHRRFDITDCHSGARSTSDMPFSFQ